MTQVIHIIRMTSRKQLNANASRCHVLRFDVDVLKTGDSDSGPGWHVLTTDAGSVWQCADNHCILFEFAHLKRSDFLLSKVI